MTVISKSFPVRLTIGLLITIVLTTASVTAYALGVKSNAEKITNHETRINRLETEYTGVRESLGRIEGALGIEK